MWKLHQKKRKQMSKLIQKTKDRAAALYRNWKYKQDKYFKPVSYSSKNYGLEIELLKGPFKGIIYTYLSFNIDEDLGDSGAQASFEIEILNEDMGEKQKQELLTNVKLAEITGQILLIVIEAALKNMTENYYRENLADEEDRESYIEEPLPKRTVRSKGSSISKDRVSSREIGKDLIRGDSEVRSEVQSDTKP